MRLGRADFKQIIIAVAIAVAGGLYWMWKRKANTSGVSQAQANNTSAASGTAGAIAPASSINTFNVFPPSQAANVGSNTALYGNTGASNTVPSGPVVTSKGQTYPLPSDFNGWGLPTMLRPQP